LRLPNPLRESLTGGKFCHVVELVASRISREARHLDTAAQLARIPGVVAGSITSYAGGSPGHDPIRVGTAARARGLTPNIHLTCVSRNRSELRRALEDLHALDIENVFALTGDYPQGAPSVFDLDSVALVSLIQEMRQGGMPFWIAVAVSPFKYTEPDCVYQYIKLEKKFAAGADWAITQVGWDVRKLRELQQYLRERGIQKPILGNVYVLNKRAAEKMAKSEPPGCWVSQELLERVQAESKAADGGEAARLERAARMVAVLRGLGYAGAYIGGTHKAEHIRWIIKRGEALAPKWEEYAEELTYGMKGGFYMYESTPSPPQPLKGRARVIDYLGRTFTPTVVPKGSSLQRLFTRFFGWIDRRPFLARSLERAEVALKAPMFGCKSCGNCVLIHMENVCPQTCPKQIRNGPCGGTNNGQCEVIPDQKCIWVGVYERAKAANELEQLKVYIPPPDRSLQGTSAWINYFLNRDSRPEKPAPPPAAQERPLSHQKSSVG